MKPLALTRRHALAGATLAAGTALNTRTARAADEELVFSIHVDLTGPASYSGGKQAEGFKDYVEWINAKGGIRGRKVRMLLSDTTFKVDVAVAGFKKVLAETKPIFLSGDSTAMIQAITPENNATHKILMTSGSLATEFDDTAKFPYHFLAGSPYGTQMELLLIHIKATHKGSAPPSVAIVHSSIPLGRDGIEKAREVAGRLGIDLKLVQQTKFIEADVGPFALALRQARPDYCIFHGYAFSVWPEVVRLVRDYGLKTQFLGTIWTMEREQIMQLTDVTDGYMGVSPYVFSSADTSKPMLAAIDQMQRKRNPKFDGYPPIGYVQSWTNAMMATKAIELTVDAGKPLTGDNLADALRGLKNWDTGGIFGVPVSVTGQKIGVGRIYRWNAKAAWTPEPVSDWLVSA